MSSTESAFDRLGGADGIDRLISGLYDRVLGDPVLAPFFAGSDMTHLLAMQREFVATALGGPIAQATTTIHDVHTGRGIRARHYMRFLDHFLATLQDAGLDERDVDRLLERMAVAAPDVIDETAEDG